LVAGTGSPSLARHLKLLKRHGDGQRHAGLKAHLRPLTEEAVLTLGAEKLYRLPYSFVDAGSLPLTRYISGSNARAGDCFSEK
jgi:hypothetical protein